MLWWVLNSSHHTIGRLPRDLILMHNQNWFLLIKNKWIRLFVSLVIYFAIAEREGLNDLDVERLPAVLL